jgi:hypothetical protein
MKYFQNGGTSGNTGNRCHLYFFKYKSPILVSNLDSTLNFEFMMSFCQYLSVIVFDLYHLFCKKVRLEGFIKKFIIREPSEINNLFLLYLLTCQRFGRFFALSMKFFLCFIRLLQFFKIDNKKMSKTSFF